MTSHSPDIATEAFFRDRNLLFTIAYEMLGSASDAEDVLQETWLRWVNVDIDQVRDYRAYLVRITTRQSLNLLRTQKRRREEYVRQIASRARKHVEERRPRLSATRSETRAALESFLHAVDTGDIQALLNVLSPDVMFVADGGGLKKAALKPLTGSMKLANAIVHALRKSGSVLQGSVTTINGGPALLMVLDGEVDGIMVGHVEDSKITGLYYVRNPEKLSWIDTQTSMTLQ